MPPDLDFEPSPEIAAPHSDRPEINHLFNHSVLLPLVARAIHEEFWIDRNGYSREDLERLLARATSSTQLPLCLAALVVVESNRTYGIGTALAGRLLEHAARLGCDAAYLGTDAPAYYARFGATFHEQARQDLVTMRCPTRGR